MDTGYPHNYKILVRGFQSSIVSETLNRVVCNVARIFFFNQTKLYVMRLSLKEVK